MSLYQSEMKSQRNMGGMRFGRVPQPHRPRCADIASEDAGEIDATITGCKLHFKAPPSSKISLSLLVAKHVNLPTATLPVDPGSTTIGLEQTRFWCLYFLDLMLTWGMEKARLHGHRRHKEKPTSLVRGQLAFPYSFCRIDG